MNIEVITLDFDIDVARTKRNEAFLYLPLAIGLVVFGFSYFPEYINADESLIVSMLSVIGMLTNVIVFAFVIYTIVRSTIDIKDMVPLREDILGKNFTA